MKMVKNFVLAFLVLCSVSFGDSNNENAGLEEIDSNKAFEDLLNVICGYHLEYDANIAFTSCLFYIPLNSCNQIVELVEEKIVKGDTEKCAIPDEKKEE